VTDRTIELSTTVAAPPDAVFRALTDAGELVRWFPSSAESDPRTGGAFEYRFEFDDESRNHVYGGEYRAAEPGARVAYPWHGKLGTTEVEFRLRPAGERTELVLVHSGWGSGEEWTESREMHRQGWGFFLDNLRAYLERGDDGRAAAMGMKTGAAPAGRPR
jgi:uncharacterized protein YndB with AHSA1/START domain